MYLIGAAVRRAMMAVAAMRESYPDDPPCPPACSASRQLPLPLSAVHARVRSEGDDAKKTRGRPPDRGVVIIISVWCRPTGGGRRRREHSVPSIAGSGRGDARGCAAGGQPVRVAATLRLAWIRQASDTHGHGKLQPLGAGHRLLC